MSHIPSTVHVLPSGSVLLVFAAIKDGSPPVLWANLRWPDHVLIVGCDLNPGPEFNGPLWWSGLGGAKDGQGAHNSLADALAKFPVPKDLAEALTTALSDPQKALDHLMAQPLTPDEPHQYHLWTGPSPQ